MLRRRDIADYQSRRLGIRYRPQQTPYSNPPEKGGKSVSDPTQFVSTLKATDCAVPRMIVCLLENYQPEDVPVVIPDPLRPFMGGIQLVRRHTRLSCLISDRIASFVEVVLVLISCILY